MMCSCCAEAHLGIEMLPIVLVLFSAEYLLSLPRASAAHDGRSSAEERDDGGVVVALRCFEWGLVGEHRAAN